MQRWKHLFVIILNPILKKRIMQKKLLAVFLCIPFVLFSQKSISIIPQPVSVKQTEGSFIFSQNTGLVFDTKDAELQSAAHFFVIQVKNVSGLSLQMNKQTRSSVILKIDPKKDANKEAYQLSVTPSSIKIVANNKAGILYGMQSVLQTLPSIRTNQTLEVPCMEITDQPRFKWRGMHLDVSRHFFSADVIKEYIDLMAIYKMNIFHWHLCDDQGWRIEIKQYPKLTQVGAWRVDRTDKVWGDREPAKENEPVTYGGYYTQQQIKEIIAYAAERNITIVPEIEMPGHSAAALAAYPQFSCSQQPQLVVTGGNILKVFNLIIVPVTIAHTFSFKIF
jgi:hexosaminidase